MPELEFKLITDTWNDREQSHLIKNRRLNPGAEIILRTSIDEKCIQTVIDIIDIDVP